MRFDWYAATFPTADAHELATGLARELGGALVVTTPHNGYSAGLAVERMGSRVATVYYGGNNGGPHAFATSEHAASFARVARLLYPEHRVSRMDVAEDFDEPGVFERLLGELRDVRTERRLAYSMAGAWDDDGDEKLGRTFYLGSRKSDVLVRLYEKGKELLTHELPEGYVPSLDLTRLEIQVRPQGDSKTIAAHGSPEDAWGYAVWAQDVASRVLGLDVERVHIKVPRRSDRDRALQSMVQQYARHISDEANETEGGAAALGEELVRRALLWLSRNDSEAA